jgi:hypothetical protein
MVMVKTKKFECMNCLKEWDGEENDEPISDTEGNVFCTKDCRAEFRRNYNDELKSAGE